jgi:hypothetical protein
MHADETEAVDQLCEIADTAEGLAAESLATEGLAALTFISLDVFSRCASRPTASEDLTAESLAAEDLAAARDHNHDQMVRCIAEGEVRAERAERAMMKYSRTIEDRLRRDKRSVAALGAPMCQIADLLRRGERIANQLTHDRAYGTITAMIVNARVIAELIVEMYNHGPIPTTDEVAAAAMRQLTNLVKALGRINAILGPLVSIDTVQ